MLMLAKKFRDLIIGKDTFIVSWVEYKNAILRGHLIVVSIFVAITYLITDRVNQIYGNEVYYFVLLVTSITTLIINRYGHYRLANVLFMSMINALVFLFASNDINRSGIYMFFLIAGITGFALFGHKDRPLAILFASISVFLFFLSYWGGFTIQPTRVYTEQFLKVNFAINFVVSFTTGIALLYFLIDINYATERELVNKNVLLTKANQELDRFVYSASHDLRAPLRSLLGLIEVSQKSIDAEEVQQCLDLMRQRVHNLDDLIREIIDFSRNARQDVKKERFSLLPIVKEIVDNLKFAEGLEKVYVRIDISPEFEVESDKARVKVILNNLIGNAFKYHDEAKEQQEVFVKAIREGNQARIDIEDNGVGIAEEHQHKIFDMFYRAHEKSQGSGLGLYIVRETLAKVNGSIQLKSKPGGGSVFSVWLPE